MITLKEILIQMDLIGLKDAPILLESQNTVDYLLLDEGSGIELSLLVDETITSPTDHVYVSELVSYIKLEGFTIEDIPVKSVENISIRDNKVNLWN
jgi:hypothetical protein